MGGSPEATSTGSFAFAGGGESFGDLLDRHIIHLLSTPREHNIEKDLALEFRRLTLPESDIPPCTFPKLYTSIQGLSSHFFANTVNSLRKIFG